MLLLSLRQPCDGLWPIRGVDGGMENILLMGVILQTLDKPIKTSNAVLTHIHRQRSPTRNK